MKTLEIQFTLWCQWSAVLACSPWEAKPFFFTTFPYLRSIFKFVQHDSLFLMGVSWINVSAKWIQTIFKLNFNIYNIGLLFIFDDERHYFCCLFLCGTSTPWVHWDLTCWSSQNLQMRQRRLCSMFKRHSFVKLLQSINRQHLWSVTAQLLLKSASEHAETVVHL